MSFWDGRKTLITGGSGFIGSHLVDHLLDAGADVRVVGRNRDNLEKKIGDRISGVDFYTGDIRDPDVAVACCKDRDSVFHLAAQVAGAGWNSAHPGTMLTQNLACGIHMLDGAVKNNVERFLCVSSACVYQSHCTVPTPEDEGFVGEPDQSNFGYGWSKRTLEAQARGYAQEYPMKIGIVRPYNGYGPRDDFEPETSHAIPALIRKVVEGMNPIEVWGDGSQARSFIYVSDFVKGLMLGLEKYPKCEPVNIGTDEEVTITKLIENIIRIANRNVLIKYDTTRPMGQPRRNGDFQKAHRVLGFKPDVPLDEGLKRTIDWYLNYRELSA